MSCDLVSLHSKILDARDRIKDHVRWTPLEYSSMMSSMGANVYIKLESEQITGSFKARGAFAKVSLLSREVPKVNEITTASSGNHALATTLAMKKLGMKGRIFVSNAIAKSKKESLEREGATLVFVGTDCVEGEIEARRVSQEEGVPFISPYNDIDVVAGQGTIGYEILKDLPDVDVVLVPVGGGGLIGGIAAYLKNAKPSTQVIGCQPVQSKVMYESVKAGRIIFEESGDTLSDGTAGGLEENSVTFDICRKCVDDWILVSETEIAKAVYFMMEYHHKIVEGAAGVALGAFLQAPARFKDKNVVIVSCGSNISMDKIEHIIATCKK